MISQQTITFAADLVQFKFNRASEGSQNNKTMETKTIIHTTENFAISSNLFPCVFVGMYGTALSPTNYEEVMNECDDPDRPFSYFTIDSEKWELEILDRSVDFIREEVLPIMRKYGVQDITVDSIHSPRYYNYENDQLYFTVHMSNGWRETMRHFCELFRNAPSTKFTDYIAEHWHSKSGFVSFMPQDFDEILDFDDEQRCLGAYLTLCLLNEDAIGLADQFYEDCVEWLYGNSSAGSTYNVFNDYLEDETEAEKYVELYNNDFRIDELYHDLYDRQGRLWRGCESIDAKHDFRVTFQAKNEAQRMIFWAVQKGLKVSDLYRIAA